MYTCSLRPQNTRPSFGSVFVVLYTRLVAIFDQLM